MNKTDLLAALDESRTQIDDVLADLRPDTLEIPGVAGAWSVKDVLAHLTACEVELLTNLGLARRGQKPANAGLDAAAVEAQNAAWYQQYRGRPLERVIEDYDGVHRQLLRQLNALAEKDLNAALSWRRGQTLRQYIEAEVLEHEAAHLPALQAWLETHRASGAEANDG
ncbi:MAG: maleylpyruvate isomerase N-terminal domain-containing protein [Anaerolineales bacterium]|nr:maleylpyruvate isomerase N-terminal domain-containing protein [Anaerolineales bacterium]